MKHNRFFQFCIRLGCFLVLFFFFTKICTAQTVTCNGTPLDLSTCEAPVQNTVQQFVCIDAVSNPDIMYWINQPPGLGMKSYAASATQPQFLYIDGYLEIGPDGLGNNYSFFQSEIIFANNASGIKVKSGAKLTINGTYLHGCNDMWDYIRAEILANIDVRNGSSIEDGRYAIWGYQTQSTIRVVNSNFKRNAFSIVMTNDPFGNTPPISIFSDGISSNIIDGGDQLLNNVWQYDFPQVGILIDRILNPVKIGQSPTIPNQIIGSNQFIEFDGFNSTGIASQNVNLTIENSKFRGIQSSSSNTYGVRSVSTSNAHTTKVVGLPDLDGNGPNQPDFTFENLRFGLVGDKVNLDVQNARFNLNNSCIIQQHGNLKPISCHVTGCEMRDYQNVGVVVANSTGIPLQNTLEVIGNTFQDGIISAPASSIYGGKRFGVRAESIMPMTLKKGWIWDNEFYNNPKAGEGYLKGGILLSNVSRATVEANEITDSDGNYNPGSKFSGIIAEACHNIKFISNEVEGTNPPFYVTTGITNQDSDNSTFNCNSVNLVSKGIEFIGASPNTSMIQNQFHQHEYAGLFSSADLNSGVGAITGDIVRGENEWNGSNAFAEAWMEWVATPANFGDYDPNNPSQWPLVSQRGLYKINSPGDNDPNDTYWPSPRIIGNEEDFNAKWFQKLLNENPSGQSYCIANGLVPGGGGEQSLSQGDLLILQGLYPSGSGEGWAWDAKFRFYGKLKNNPDLRPSGTEVSDWYDMQDESAIGKLYDGFEGLRNLSALSETQQIALDAAYADLEAAIQEANNIATELHQAFVEDNSTKITALYTQRENNTALTISRTITYESLLNSIRTDILQQAGIMFSDLSNISTSAGYETNMKTILHTQLEMILAETGMTETQRNIFENIASQCRYEGGWGVVMARLMLPENTYDDGVFCGGGERSQNRISSASDTKIIVSPNPTRGLLNLYVNQPFIEGIGSIHDAQGRFIRGFKFSQDFPQIQDLNLAPGVYFLSISLDGKSMPMCRFVVVP